MNCDATDNLLLVSVCPIPSTKPLKSARAGPEDPIVDTVEDYVGSEASICYVQQLEGEQVQLIRMPDAQPLPCGQSLAVIRKVIQSLLKVEASLSGQVNSIEYRAAGLVVSEASNHVCYYGRDLDFTRMEYAILKELVKQPGVVLSREYLYKAVTGRDFIVHIRSLDVHISRIRRKLTAAGMPEESIVSHRGEGYQFC